MIGPARIRDLCPAWGLCLAQDLRLALRGLRRRPAFALLAIGTLALGIGVNTALFTVVDAVLLRPLPYPEPERLVTIWASHRERGRYGASLQDYEDWRVRSSSFEEMGAFATRSGNLTTSGAPLQIDYALVSPSLLRTLGVAPRLGRWFDDEENQPGRDDVALLGHALWRQEFGGAADVVGKSVRIEGRRLRVVGVMPAGFDFPEGRSKLWKPFGMGPEDGGSRDGRWVRTVARLTPGRTAERAGEEIAGIMSALEQEYPETNQGFFGEVEPLLETVAGEARPALSLLALAVGAVLLIACVNVATLLFGRAAERAQGEFAVRAALGASRGRVVAQMLVESAVIAILGGAVALVLARVLVSLLPALGSQALPRAGLIEFAPTTFAFACLAALLCALASGAAPALWAMRLDPAGALRAGARRTTSARRWLRGALVVAEIALATTVLVAAGLIGRSLAKVLAVDAGFAADQLLGFEIEPEWRFTLSDGAPEAELIGRMNRDRTRIAGVLAGLEERLLALPGVDRVGMVNTGPLTGSRWNTDFDVESRPATDPSARPQAMYRVVGADYFGTLGIPVVRGRALTAADRRDAERVVVIDEALARAAFGDADPIGQRLAIDGSTWYRVVGVVGRVADVGLETAPAPKLYFAFEQAQWGFFGSWHVEYFLRTSRSAAAMGGAIRSVLAGVDPGLPAPEIEPARKLVDRAVESKLFAVRLLGGFAALALLLASIGLYGVIAHAVRSRSREFGIRAALGAGPATLVRSTLAEGLSLTALGLALGVGGAAASAALIRSQLFGVGVADPATYALAALTLGGVALISCLAPALSVARTDPARILRVD